MADPDMEEDLFADLYDGEADEPEPPKPAATVQVEEPVKAEPEEAPVKTEPQSDSMQQPATDDFNTGADSYPADNMQGLQNNQQEHGDEYDRPIGIKEDGKMFIGGLNWETTDQSLKDYFTQFGEVVESTVMRDGATGRSRGFGFLTFKDPKTVNIVMVKEHFLDGKLVRPGFNTTNSNRHNTKKKHPNLNNQIDPKRAIPREEQERTAKIFVGGVSQECTDPEFREFFEQFGRVLDATLMMDKDTGRPRGFGFVTFDSDAAVDRTLDGPLAIHGKVVEVKRAEPRGNLRDGDGGGGGHGGKFGRGRGGGHQFGNDNPNNQAMGNGQDGNTNNMSPAMMAQYWQRMQQYFQMMRTQLMNNGGQGAGGGMNPMMAMQQNPQMMQQMMAQQGMNPAMMQQMQQMAGMQGGGNNGGGGGFQGMSPNPTGSPMNGGQGNGGPRPGFNASEQLMFEQQKYERQQQARVNQGDFQGGNTWEGMYDDVPAPQGFNNNNMRGGGGGGGFRGGNRRGGGTPQPPAQAPANAPTGPKNAGMPGANYRGGGRGGRRGYHPYARGGM